MQSAESKTACPYALIREKVSMNAMVNAIASRIMTNGKPVGMPGRESSFLTSIDGLHAAAPEGHAGKPFIAAAVGMIFRLVKKMTAYGSGIHLADAGADIEVVEVSGAARRFC